ncbi:MAG: hypothetical protein K8S20_00570 [Chloroflexi bacterium]|nr:hypothetical protein [Chloroflexota bacterium]
MNTPIAPTNSPLGEAGATGTALAPDVKYIRPTVNLVAFHEIEALYTEDPFFDIASLILGPVLGIIIERFINGSLAGDYLAILVGLLCIAFLIYYANRLKKKHEKISALIAKGISVPYPPPEGFTSSQAQDN